MQDEAYVRIPLHARDGSVRAYALIDPEDRQLTRHNWSLTAQGYAQRRIVINGRASILLLHREILGLKHGDKRHGDHINLDRLDCRRQNLRVGTQALNNQNQAPRGRTSRYRGVWWRRDIYKWAAGAHLNGRSYYLGVYADEMDAARAARAFREVHMPFAVEEAA